MMSIISTTTIPVSGQREGKQCTVFPPDLWPGSSGKEECCPEGQVWSFSHGAPGTYWDCEPDNPKPPVSGQREGEQCRGFPVNINSNGSGGFDPLEPSILKEECCPKGQVWEWEHPEPGTYWGCEPANPSNVTGP